MTRLLIALAIAAVLASPVHADAPVPPDGCSLPGLPSCEIYRHHIYMPLVEARR